MLYCIAAPLGRGSCWHKLCLVLLLPKGANVSYSCRYSQKEAWQGWPNMVMLWVFGVCFFSTTVKEEETNRLHKSAQWNLTLHGRLRKNAAQKPQLSQLTRCFYIFLYIFNCWLQSKLNTICCAHCAVCQMWELMVRLESGCRRVEQLYYCGPQTLPWVFLGFFFWSLWGNFRNSPSVSFLTLHSRTVLVLRGKPNVNLKRESTGVFQTPKDDASRAQAVQANRPKNLHLYGAHILFPSCLLLSSLHLPHHRG